MHKDTEAVCPTEPWLHTQDSDPAPIYKQGMCRYDPSCQVDASGYLLGSHEENVVRWPLVLKWVPRRGC